MNYPKIVKELQDEVEELALQVSFWKREAERLQVVIDTRKEP